MDVCKIGFLLLLLRIRNATPLEEAQRSWNVRRSELDIQFNSIIDHHAQRLVKPFTNIDNDDHLTQEIPKEKLAKSKKAQEK